jgi:transcriptional regulator of NAD metabolism
MPLRGEDRRKEILALLSRDASNHKGSDLAFRFGVSRQVIVQDMAILRAAGVPVLSTPQGYALLADAVPQGEVRLLVTRHRTNDAMEEELCLIVDNGGRVLDVVVEHPLYGEMTGALMLASRADVAEFMEKVRGEGVTPLSALTDGLHLHHVEVRDGKTFERIRAALRKAGYLIESDEAGIVAER